MADKIEIPFWFKFIAWLALIWNLMGVFAFYTQLSASPELLATLSQAEQEIIKNYPTWFNVAFGTAVIGGALASIALLFKKSVAFYLYCLSLIGVLGQFTYSFLLTDNAGNYGPGGYIMPIMIIVVSLYLIMLSRNATKQGWLN